MDHFTFREVVLNLDWHAATLQLRLTPQRLRILHGLMLDETLDEIAKALSIKRCSVETTICRMRKKYRVHTRAALVSLALGAVIAGMDGRRQSSKE